MATKSRPVAAVELHRIEADLAAINVRLDVIERGLQTLTHHVGGSGKPGLMERVQAHDLALDGLKSTMEAVGSQLGRLEEMHVELLEKGQAEHQAIIRQVELLADRLNHHMSPENLQHQTLARAFMVNPKKNDSRL